MAKLYVDDVPVGVKELYEVLGIDPKSIPNKLARVFEIHPNKIRKDEQGNEKTPRRLGIPTKFNAFIKSKGMNVTVRYAREVQKDNKNGYVTLRYSPGQLWINGREENVIDDIEYAFRYIHPDCYNSPFRQLNGTFRYLFKDVEANANADLLKDEQEMRAMSLIIGNNAWAVSQLRQVAKGLHISGVDALTDAEVKNRLKMLAKANPNQFFDDARSRNIQFSGLLQDVVDQNVVKIVSNNGFRRWHFVNQEICVIPSGANEMEALRQAVANDMELIPQFKTALEGRTVESVLDKPENQKFFDSFDVDQTTTKGDVSPNLKAENKAIDGAYNHEANIKALSEEEDLDISGVKQMHHARKKSLQKYRAEVDAYKALLQSA